LTKIQEARKSATVGGGAEIVTYVITEPCVDIKDKGCLEVCPVDCIYEGDRTLYIHPDECIDCHACDPVCPVEAIFPEDEVPPEFARYVRVNAEFFTETTQLGTPGGAAPLGPLGIDHPHVAALPARSPAS
jgi:NAD-dependent dihydropyrimidine dehydrogenase PreA subunit